MQGPLVVGDARKRVAVMSYKRKLPILTDREFAFFIVGMGTTAILVNLIFGCILVLYLLEAAQ